MPRRRRNEEVRGLFVLGVIGVLLVIRTQGLPPEVQVLVDTLLAFWAAYAFLAVVGLSEDIFGKRIGEIAYLLGLYALGCAVVYCISFALLYLGTSAIVALILFLSPPPACIPHDLLALVGCIFGEEIGQAILAGVVFFVLLVPALLAPPVIVARGMSQRYGKKIWRICIATLITIVVGYALFLLSMFKLLP